MMMKTSLVSLVTLVTLGLTYVPGCGGKSETTYNQANGGQGGAGSEGYAGVGAGPATHVTECESLCERTTTEGCTADVTSCLLVCATVTGYATCQPEVEQWLNCAKKSPIVCDSSGVPSFSNCDLQLMTVAGCAVAQKPPPAVAKSCAGFCKEVDRTSCSVSTELGDCSQMCAIAGNVVSACQRKFVSFTDCQAKSGVTCDASGTPTMTGCESEQLVYLGCLMTEVGEGTQ